MLQRTLAWSVRTGEAWPGSGGGRAACSFARVPCFNGGGESEGVRSGFGRLAASGEGAERLGEPAGRGSAVALGLFPAVGLDGPALGPVSFLQGKEPRQLSPAVAPRPPSARLLGLLHGLCRAIRRCSDALLCVAWLEATAFTPGTSAELPPSDRLRARVAPRT